MKEKLREAAKVLTDAADALDELGVLRAFAQRVQELTGEVTEAAALRRILELRDFVVEVRDDPDATLERLRTKAADAALPRRKR